MIYISIVFPKRNPITNTLEGKKMKKTQSKNARHRRRSGKNLFWLARDRRGTKSLILYHRKPTLRDYFVENYRHEFVGGKWWESFHETHYLHTHGILDRFSDIDYDTEPVPVKLILMGIKCWDGIEEKPDLYIQRYRDCLFIAKNYTESWIGGDKKRKCLSVPHDMRISNKLFPDVTEESGIVGVKVVPYYEWNNYKKLDKEFVKEHGV